MEFCFNRVFGQEQAQNFLTGPLTRESFPSSLLISGNSGLGQEPLALDLAQALLCQSSDKKACGSCRACLDFLSQNQSQLKWLFPLAKVFQKTKESRMEGGSQKAAEILKAPYEYSPSRLDNLSIDQIRDLKESVGYTLEKGKKRVVLLFFAEFMLEPAANSLLKILEEPPADSYFILTTSDKSRLLPTILSRCIHLPLEELSREQLAEYIETRPVETRENLIPWSYVSGGSPGQLLRNGGLSREVLQLSLDFLNLSLSGNWEPLAEFLDSHGEFNEMDSSLVILKTSLNIFRQIYLEKPVQLQQPEMMNLSQKIADMEQKENFVSYLQNSLEFISRYSKSSVAILGNYMKWLDKEVAV